MPHLAASLTAALIAFLGGVCSPAGFCGRTAVAQFPPGFYPDAYSGPPSIDAAAGDSAAGRSSFRTVRPAPIPKDAETAGYFRPLYQPPKTQVALEQVVEFDVVDMPMEQFFAGLEATTGIPFFLDETGLEETAITSDAEITCRSAGMPLYIALDLIMRDLYLAYVVHDEYVLVTSRDSADLIPRTRLFALADHPLLQDAGAASLAAIIRQHATRDRWGGWWYCLKVDLPPGAIAISGERDAVAWAEQFLRQYARLLAEYDAAPAPASSAGSPIERPSPIVAVRRAPIARDASRYFQAAHDRTKAALTLAKPADFEIEDLPLDQFFIGRERILGIPFRLDAVGLQASLIEPDDPVSFRAKGLSHEAALSLMLRDFDLKLVPRDDYVVVTSVDDERYQVTKRTYDVAGHPLLAKDGGRAFLESLRRQIAHEGMKYPKEYGIGVRQGKLILSADDAMLEHAESYIKQYGRLLTEYDVVDRNASPPGEVQGARSARGTGGDVCFRPLWRRPRTLRALEQPATIDVREVPLDSFFAGLERKLGIAFELDESGFEEAALTTDAEVTFQASGMTYAAALTQMLAGLDLAFVASDHYVRITSQDAADLEIETRLYAIHDHPRLRGKELQTLVGAIRDHVGDDDVRNDGILLDLLPGALIVTGDREALAMAEEGLRPYGLAPAEYSPERPAPAKPSLKFRLPPRRVVPAPPPDRNPYPIRPEMDPFAEPSGGDPFGKPPADPFGDSAADPFAPSAAGGR